MTKTNKKPLFLNTTPRLSLNPYFSSTALAHGGVGGRLLTNQGGEATVAIIATQNAISRIFSGLAAIIGLINFPSAVLDGLAKLVSAVADIRPWDVIQRSL